MPCASWTARGAGTGAKAPVTESQPPAVLRVRVAWQVTAARAHVDCPRHESVTHAGIALFGDCARVLASVTSCVPVWIQRHGVPNHARPTTRTGSSHLLC